jgi:hypothetical protein
LKQGHCRCKAPRSAGERLPLDKHPHHCRVAERRDRGLRGDAVRVRVLDDRQSAVRRAQLADRRDGL